jgi:hypothetical protein
MNLSRITPWKIDARVIWKKEKNALTAANASSVPGSAAGSV